MYERREGKVNRCQAPKKKSLKREGAGMREPFHQSLTFPNIETKTKKEEEKGKDKWPKVNQKRRVGNSHTGHRM